MQTSTAREKYLPPGVLGISLLVVYWLTLAPGLTWANHGSDGGDLVAAAATGGVAHPTGYPVYLLLARAFQWLPIGSLAFRTNLMSALAAAVASVLVYGLVTRSLPAPNEGRRWLVGLVSAYAFGLAPLLWSQAVITEVYALQALFIVLILYLSTVPLPLATKQLDSVLGLVFGLAMGNHVTTILMLPLILFSTVSRRAPITVDLSTVRHRFWDNWQLDGRSLFRRLAWLGVGLLVYLTLPLRALFHPPVNWGNPVTLDNFGWLVSARLYQDELFVLTLPSIWARIQSAAALLLDQFGLLGLVVSLTGLVVFFTPSALVRNTLWMLVAFSTFAIGYATDDSYLYLIPAMLSFAVWIGLGLHGVMEVVSRRFPKIGLASGLVFLAYLFVVVGGHWPQVDASHDLRAEQFGETVLAQAPADALVFMQGDEAVFTMWYFHYALHKRADLAVIATDLLHFAWYQDTLKAAYPSLKIIGPFPFYSTIISSNPERPVCYIQYYEQAVIRCNP
jgi:hypothetical protein